MCELSTLAPDYTALEEMIAAQPLCSPFGSPKSPEEDDDCRLEIRSAYAAG